VAGMQQAVLEFDAAVIAPWRPLLGSGTGPRVDAPLRPVAAPAPRPVAVRAGAGRSPAAGPPVWPRPRGPRGAAPGSAAASRPVRGGCAAPTRRAAPALRLTRRGRRLLATLALGGGVALASWLGPLVGGWGGGDLRLAGVSTVVVEPGDTVWSIAAAAAGDEDVRSVVDRIQRLNHLDGTVLRPGQVLELP
jgi:nucleoid-associated protein YgaU